MDEAQALHLARELRDQVEHLAHDGKRLARCPKGSKHGGKLSGTAQTMHLKTLHLCPRRGGGFHLNNVTSWMEILGWYPRRGLKLEGGVVDGGTPKKDKIPGMKKTGGFKIARNRVFRSYFVGNLVKTNEMK